MTKTAVTRHQLHHALGGQDDSSPLQAALHIQAYPTIDLLDRNGRVLWRDQGATPTTFSRLDRVLASATQGGTSCGDSRLGSTIPHVAGVCDPVPFLTPERPPSGRLHEDPTDDDPGRPRTDDGISPECF